MPKHFFLISFVFNIFSTTLIADVVSVYNKADIRIYVAIYKQKGLIKKQQAIRFTQVKAIEPNEYVQLNRPPKEFGFDRELVFSLVPTDLKNELSVIELNSITHTNVGDAQGNTVYIADKNGLLHGYNTAEWHIAEPLITHLSKLKKHVIRTMTQPIKELVKSQYDSIKENPYKNSVAHVRHGNQLHEQERAYLTKRKPLVHKALEKFLGHPIQKTAIPTIAFVESGGGFRAMTCSIGWHLGAIKTGLMDAVTYMVGLSGSTWSIALWLSSGLKLEDFVKKLTPLMQTGVSLSTDEFVLIADNFMVKTAFSQELTLVDIFGGFLSNVVFKNYEYKRQQVRLSSQAGIVSQAQIPFPIYTAVRGDEKVMQEWYEFTPYEIGASWLGLYVPTWAFGRKFKNGKSIDDAPEQSLGYLMATWGSAFAATINQMFSTLKSKESSLKPPFDMLVDGILDRIGQERITAAEVFNFTSGMQASRIKNYPLLSIVDAGTAFNLPYPPISGERPERFADIIIILDASGGAVGDELHKVEYYAHSKKLKLPLFNYNEIGKKAISIFKDDKDPSVPLVIYLPRIKDEFLIKREKNNKDFKEFVDLIQDFDIESCIKKEYCSTFNFKYTPQEVKQLSALAEFNIRSGIQEIKKAIEWKMNQLSLKK